MTKVEMHLPSQNGRKKYWTPAGDGYGSTNNGVWVMYRTLKRKGIHGIRVNVQMHLIRVTNVEYVGVSVEQGGNICLASPGPSWPRRFVLRIFIGTGFRVYLLF